MMRFTAVALVVLSSLGATQSTGQNPGQNPAQNPAQRSPQNPTQHTGPYTAQPVTIQVTNTVQMLAFADDGASALAMERNDTGTAVSETILIIGTGGVQERLPLSQRIRLGATAKDGISGDACRAVADRLQAMARDYRGVSVRGGLCSHPERPIVAVSGRPNPVPVSADVGLVHAAVGFAGPTFVSPRKVFAIVVGTDFNGNVRIGTAPWPRQPLRP